MPPVFEPEVAAGRRAFPTAQALLSGVAARRVEGLIDVGWHGSDVHRETGSFAVASVTEFEDLIGETIRVTYGDRSVYAFVLGARDVPVGLSLTRRTFLGIAPLAEEFVSALVEVIG